MKRSFGVWMPSWKYVYIFLRRVACLVGYNFMIYSTCHTPKESSVLFLFGAKHCILYCVFIGLSKYYTNGHCFPKRLLFKRWIFFVFSPSPTPPFSPSPLTSHHPHRELIRINLGKKWWRLCNLLLIMSLNNHWENDKSLTYYPLFLPDFSILFFSFRDVLS